MPIPYYTSPLAGDGTYEQWTFICDSGGGHVRYQKSKDLVGKPTVLSSTDVPLAEFLASNEGLLKIRLQAILDGR
jgi:hypothetical protein